MPTNFAVHTDNRKREYPVSKLDIAFIRAMADETAGVTAGAWDKVQIKRIYCFIVKILRNKVVVFCINCYHRYA